MKMSDLKYFGLFIIDINMNGFGTVVYVFGQGGRKIDNRPWTMEGRVIKKTMDNRPWTIDSHPSPLIYRPWSIVHRP